LTTKSKRTTPPKATIADVLRKAIEQSELSVYAIAKAADVPQPVLHRFYAGERDLTLATANKLAVYFGLELTPKGQRGR
jgi:plasmid maintenance system antidote protein VapI